jgi:hypothetical protein
MVLGSSAVNLANKWLNMFSNTAFTAPTATYVKLHTADPGASGTSSASTVTTQPAVTWAVAAAGSKASNSTPSWAAWGGTNGEVVTHISVWDAATTAGNFLFSAALSASKTVNSGDTLNLTSLSYALTPIAA